MKDLRVLIVDDNANMRRVVATILRSVGTAELREAENGAAALELLARWTPDVALVDYVMDGIDGVSFTRAVRQHIDQVGRRLPIVIMTAHSELWRLGEATRAGADDFIVKPFTARTLLQRVAQVADIDLRTAASH